jgi:hypothetical protein
MTPNHTHLKSNKSKVCLVFDDQRLTCVCVQLQYLKLSLIQHLTPYVYFRFQLGFLYYKSFNILYSLNLCLLCVVERAALDASCAPTISWKNIFSEGESSK